MTNTRKSSPDDPKKVPDPTIEEPHDDVVPEVSPPRGGLFGAVAMTLLMVGAGGGVAWLLRDYVTTSPRFRIAEVIVLGGQPGPSSKVEAQAGIERGANIFSVDLMAARGRLMSDPWVKDATLVRRLPGTITIHLERREAAAIVARDGLFLATDDGELFKRFEPGDPVDLPIITGISHEGGEHEVEWSEDSVKRAIALADDYEHSPLALRAALSEVHVSPTGAMALVVGQDGVRLEVGRPPFHEKLEDAARVVSEATKRGAKLSAVLLDNEVHADRVVVRLK